MYATAQTGTGVLCGEMAASIIRFRGIPYATASRFGPPRRPAPWSGVRDATKHGPVPPQPPSRLRAAMGDFSRPQDEDCLTLTLATPALDRDCRPVLVWLHGGAYWTGAGSLDWYDGSTLAAENDVVVVGVNYRLGALGFLAHPAVSPGNLGLADMVAALAWVHENIAAFGGDPGNVTLIGQSAGAHAIMCLLTMVETKGLFHRGILMSAPPAMAPQSQGAAVGHAEFIAHRLETSVAGLMAMPTARLVDAGLQLARSIGKFADATPPFVPVFDAISTPAAFIAAAARAAGERGIPLLIGTTREEMHAFLVPDPAMNPPEPGKLAARFGELAGDPGALAAYARRRPGGSSRDLLGDLVTDHLFLMPSLALAEAAGAGAHVYQFNWAPAGNPFRSCHCIELPFLFGNPAAWSGAAMLAGGGEAEMAAMSAVFRGALTGFARGGDPSMSGLPWPTYRTPERQTMVFDTISGSVGDPAGVRWREIRPGVVEWRANPPLV